MRDYLDGGATAIDPHDAEDRFTRHAFPIEAVDDLGGGDHLLDVEVTSNRPDCLSHIGLAREFAAITRQSLKQPSFDLPDEAGPDVNTLTSVANEASDLCPVYTARVITGVKVGPSPQWLQDRLTAIGLRCINNIVDITNFVLHEMGQPLHAFDMNKLAERRIVVRRARKGETMTAIDGSNLALAESMLVIADADKPVAVAGVMGGLDSEVGQATTDILLESASFEPLNVRATSRALKLHSDSSYRFERGVDPAGIEVASRRAAALIVELAGGTLAKGVVRVGDDVPPPHNVAMRISRCNALLGIEVDGQRMVDHFTGLGLSPVRVDDAITCTIPSYRLDLHREADLIEEISRLEGFDAVPIADRMPIVTKAIQQDVEARRALRQALIAHGFHETITFSFVAIDHGKPFILDGHEPVMVADERRKAEPMLRPSVVPSLLTCRKRNQDAGNHAVKLFETAAVWNAKAGNIIEHNRLGLITDGEDAAAALRDVRGTIEELLSVMHGHDVNVSFDESDRPGLAIGASVTLNGLPVGWMGLLDRKLQEAFDLQTPVIAAELDLSAVLADFPPQPQVSALPKFPAIERDLSIVVDESVSWQSVQQNVIDAKPELLDGITFITTYRGKPIAKGQKSLSFRMLFRDPDKTLRHDEVDPQIDRIIKRLHRQLDAELRT